jgi:hypothetical protein
LSLEMWIYLFHYDMNIWYASHNTYSNRVVLVFVHIVYETIVGQGSHQSVWTDHPTVRSHMLIAFWFFDELYLIIFLLWSIWEIFLLKPKAIFIYIFFIIVLSCVCLLNVIYLVSCWTHLLIFFFFKSIIY